MRMPRWNSPLVISVMVTLAYEVGGDLIAQWLRDSGDDVAAGVIASPLSSAVVLVIVFLILWLVQARMEGGEAARPAGPLGGSITPSGELSTRVIKGDSDEARWKTAALTFLAWLYRRDEWNGLSWEGKNAEGAPEVYARERLEHVEGCDFRRM